MSDTTVCLENHQLPCGLDVTCPHTHPGDACSSATVSKVNTNSLLNRTTNEDAEEYYLNTTEFEDCEWLVYDGKDGGVAIELVKDDEHIHSITGVGEVFNEAILYLEWKLEEEYYSDGEYWEK